MGLCVVSALAAPPSNPYLVKTFEENGRLIDQIIVPGSPPPAVKVQAVALPPSLVTLGVNTIASVPAFSWCYGCAATSAAMIMGYYDNQGCPNMYTGPANSGVCPMNNDTYWGNGESPLSATHIGKDGRVARGHVEDYWIASNNADPDPYIANGWTEHTLGDCTADFMGTSQSKYGNVDGSTLFYSYTGGSPLSDYTGCEPGQRDGCHGIRLFVESRGYTVNANFTQKIYGYNGNTIGFTYDQFKSEIDAGRPVMIHVTGHTMVGLGYDDTGSIIYIHDTWDNSNHSMTWGGYYSGMQHYGVTVLRLSCTVAYDAQGGNVSPSSQTFMLGSTYGTLPTPTRSGYTFGGWWTGANGSGVQVTSATKVNATYTTLYAKWTAVTYTVSYNGNGSTGGSTASSSHAYDVSKALTVNGFTRTGYTFAGWATSAGGAVVYSDGQSVVNLSSTQGATVQLYAKWTSVTYTVSYNGNGSTGGSTASSSHTYDVSKALTVNGFTRTGYTFAGWATSAGGAVAYSDGQSVVNLSSTQGATVQLYAKWTVSTYPVNYSGNGATGGAAPTSQTKTHDVALTLQTNSGNLVRTGYTFAGWNTAANGEGTSYAAGATYTANAAVTLYAKWTITGTPGITVTPTALNVSEGGSVTNYALVLNTPASTNVTVFVSTGGQVTVWPTNFIFMAANWNVTQMVAVVAVDDVICEGTHMATITNTVVSADVNYNGLVASNVWVTITDNDPQSLVVSTSSVAVREGLSTNFTVRLAAQPTNNVTVTTVRSSGDTDLTVSAGASLIFTPANWSTPQTVTLAAAEDADATNSSALFSVSSTGLSSVNVTATEIDNDIQGLVVTPMLVNVPEGGVTNFTVRLAIQPASSVTVTTVRSSGDTDLSVSAGMSLTFTPANWSTPQLVTLAAAEDADSLNGSGIFDVSSSGLTTINVTAYEIDNDVQGLVATPVIFPPSTTTFTNNLSVSVACATPGATIRYTTDGNDPTGSSTLYTGAFTLSSSATVKVRAYLTGMLSSAVAVAEYTKVRTLYVNAARPNDSGDGLSWSTAKQTIQAAADAAAGGDTVLVMDGIYNVGCSLMTGQSLSNRVIITKDVTVCSVNGPTATIIEGSGTNYYGMAGAIRCVYMTNGILDGFTLRKGTSFSGTFDENSYGGGVYSEGGVIKNCIISGNSAQYGGGSFYAVLYNCSVTGNVAVSSGGGSYYGALANSLVAGNMASYGGGSYYSTLNNCTVVNNSAVSGGGGVYNGYFNRTYNCIVWNNRLNNGTTNDCSSSSYAYYTCASGFPASNGNIAAVPLFVDPAAGNYRLQTNSPCIDKGGNPYAPNLPDLDGNARIFDGDSNGTNTVDMGAYEFASRLGVAMPIIAPRSGTSFAGSIAVQMSCATVDASIRYTLDGAEPSTNSTLYTGSLSLTMTTTVKAKGFKAGMPDSATAVAFLQQQMVEPPVLTPASGTLFVNSLVVTAVCSTASSEIRYTLDGTTPTAESPLYTGPITLATSTTVSAKAFKLGLADSETATADYLKSLPIPDAIDAETMTFTTGGNLPWFGHTGGTTHDGVDAARSGMITDSQTSWMQTMLSGPGTFSFWWKVGCEDDFYDNWDYLRFLIDGVEQARIDGHTDWLLVSQVLTSGTHTVRWEYCKDSVVSEPPDCGWVDQLVWIPSGQQTVLGTPYSWLDQYGLVTGGNYEAADLTDSDGDGSKAWEEYVAGTVPTNSLSVFRARIGEMGGQMKIYWTPDLTSAVPSRVYSVFGAVSLVDGFSATPVTNVPAGTSIPVQSLAPNRFFKVGVGIQP